MKYKIEQLNFLYVYKYCQELHIDTSAYSDIDIEDITTEDTVNLFYYVLYKNEISESLESFKLKGNAEVYLKCTDSDNLSKLGPIMNGKIKYLRKFKKDVYTLINNANDGKFIYYFDDVINNIKEVKRAMLDLSNTSSLKNKKSNDSIRKRAGNILFS